MDVYSHWKQLSRHGKLEAYWHGTRLEVVKMFALNMVFCLIGAMFAVCMLFGIKYMSRCKSSEKLDAKYNAALNAELVEESGRKAEKETSRTWNDAYPLRAGACR